jgi:hypothetical protein
VADDLWRRSSVGGSSRPRSRRIRKAKHINEISSYLGIARLRAGSGFTHTIGQNEGGSCFDERRSSHRWPAEVRTINGQAIDLLRVGSVTVQQVLRSSGRPGIGQLERRMGGSFEIVRMLLRRADAHRKDVIVNRRNRNW